MSNCCPNEQQQNQQDSCHSSKGKPDIILWGSFGIVAFLYLHFALDIDSTHIIDWYHTLAHAVYELVNTMWIGVLLGIIMVSLLTKVPREFVISILGSNQNITGILRATGAGVLLDLCNHGILMVAAKLYERGASVGQVMAFLIASPWNSFSLTLILITLIGLSWTLAFIGLSMIIAIITGLIFDALVKRGSLPSNPHQIDLPDDFQFYKEAKEGLTNTRFDFTFFKSMLIDGVKDSRMVIRWLLFGIILAAMIRAFVPAEYFATYFGPTLTGLGLTILAATVIEVCSEGSTPIAADLLSRANAPGNSFAFLMAGAATDYTEIMVLKDTTKSWKIALFLPLITLPQIIVIAFIINNFTI